MRGNHLRFHLGRFRLDIRKKNIMGKDFKTMERWDLGIRVSDGIGSAGLIGFDVL